MVMRPPEGNPNRIRFLILDADGTCTRWSAENEAAFAAKYSGLFRDGMGSLDEAFDAHWEECADLVRRNPHEHGFILDLAIGVVAGPTGDIMMECRSIAQVYWGKYHPADYNSFEEFDRTAYTAYQASYPLLRPTPRPELPELLRFCGSVGVRVRVATNSATKDVRKQFEGLAEEFPDFLDNIYGGANKFAVASIAGPFMGAVRQREPVPGLARGFLNWRPAYNDCLDRCLAVQPDDPSARILPQQVLVVGDNGELDGALPKARGHRFGLLRNPRTQPWELDWVRAATGDHDGRGMCYGFTSLLEIIRVIEDSRI